MSQPIWPVVLENLAEQLSATQGGIVHPLQLLPYIPVNLEQIEQTLDALTNSACVEKQKGAHNTRYVFHDSVDKPTSQFAPTHCVYSNDKLEGIQFTAISQAVRKKIEAELSLLAKQKPWPSNAVWEHELIYLINNLPAPVNSTEVAGHSRLQFKRVEARINELKERGVLSSGRTTSTLELPPMRYPKAAFERNDQYIRQFPEAIKDEIEARLIKGLIFAFIVLFLCFILLVTAKIPFPILFFLGLLTASIGFYKVFRAPSRKLPNF